MINDEDVSITRNGREKAIVSKKLRSKSADEIVDIKKNTIKIISMEK